MRYCFWILLSSAHRRKIQEVKHERKLVEKWQENLWNYFMDSNFYLFSGTISYFHVTVRRSSTTSHWDQAFMDLSVSPSTVGGFAEHQEVRDPGVPLLRLWPQRTGPGEVRHQDVLRAEGGGQVPHPQRGRCSVCLHCRLSVRQHDRSKTTDRVSNETLRWCRKERWICIDVWLRLSTIVYLKWSVNSGGVEIWFNSRSDHCKSMWYKCIIMQ